MNNCLDREFVSVNLCVSWRLPLKLYIPQVFGVASCLVIATFFFSGCATPPPDKLTTYHEIYVHPLVSSGAQFSTLPAAVQRTVCAETGSASIAQVEKRVVGAQTIYCVTFQNADLFPPLYVAADGSVLDPELRVAVGAPRDLFSTASRGPVSRVSPDELPPQVVKAMQRLAPDGEVDVISREMEGQQTIYIITFKGGSRPRLRLSSDGTPLK